MDRQPDPPDGYDMLNLVLVILFIVAVIGTEIVEAVYL